MVKGSAIIPMRQLILWAVIGSLMYPMVASESEPNDDFDSATTLESGVTHEGIIQADDIYFKINTASILWPNPGNIGLIIEFDFTDWNGEYLEFCVYDGNQSSDRVNCITPFDDGETGVTHFQKADTSIYFVKISCSECAAHDSEARYFISATLHQDEAGDSIQTATSLDPESMRYGTIHGAESDFYATPVVNGDTIRIVITDDSSGSMTSYRLYDNYGIKIAEEWELADYDFTVVAESDGDLSIELLCAFEGVCDYSIVAIGSTYEQASPDATESKGPETTSPLPIIIAVAVFIVLVITLIVISSRRNNTAIDGQTTISNTAPSEHHITSPQPLIDPAPIVQSTHSDTTVSTLMQDSVHQGDIVGGDKFDTKVVNDPEAIARAAIKGYEMGKSSGGDESD